MSLKEQILRINNTAGTLVWVSYHPAIVPGRLMLSCYHTTLSHIILNFVIRETDGAYQIFCEKYLSGKLLCRVDSIAPDDDGVLRTVVTTLKMTFGGVA